MAHSLSMLTNCYEGAELTLRYEILNSLKWQQATQIYGTQACSAVPAHLGIKLEHSTTQDILKAGEELLPPPHHSGENITTGVTLQDTTGTGPTIQGTSHATGLAITDKQTRD